LRSWDGLPQQRRAAPSVARQTQPARRRRGAEGEFDLESSGRKQGAETLRPFDQRYALGEGILDVELDRLLRVAQAVEIEMPYPPAGALVDLHQGEGRARHLPFPDEGAGE